MIQVKPLTNIIEAVVFASGDPVPVKYIVEKLGCSLKDVNESVAELKEKYSGECGVHILAFNGKLQFASNPQYKEQVQAVITPIKEKEFTRTILECAAIIAYKQPITKSELEDIRQVSGDYAIQTLLDLGMIYPCGRKDTVGKPILYATTDNFLKRFKLNSIDELPDYDELMAQIAELNNRAFGDDDEEDGNYLYKKDEYDPENDAERKRGRARSDKQDAQNKQMVIEDGYELPDFWGEGDDVIKIKDED